ncbi:MAG: histidinol dehydrogenase [Acholeplasmataceae bacterium]|nr:histidinol dehydrogenase [Acholeplasmataceae bacterium]
MIPIIKQNENNDLFQKMIQRTQFDFNRINAVVEEIVMNVKKYKDDAVRKHTQAFDGINLKDFKVSEKEFEDAFQRIDPKLVGYLKSALENIKSYHEKQMIQSFRVDKENGIMIGQIVRAIDTVGIYVPGGTANYPSTVLMNAVPAKIAGVKRLVMVTPPNKEGYIKDSILVAARLAGVDEIYKIGGAQGIAALTYGTETIPRVNKIVGPGNIYVTIAKRLVSGYVGIDMIAGPSEVLIIADDSANPDYIAADLMAQAEHDVLAASILLTDSIELANQVQKSIEKQIVKLERKKIIEESLKNYGAIVLTNSLSDSIYIANQLAPEHLEILTKKPEEVLEKIENAGAIFLGPYTPEPVGDYYAGPNHTLPTSGTARFASALSTLDFLKKTSVVSYSKEALLSASEAIIGLANEEGLTAHANSIAIRF